MAKLVFDASKVPDDPDHVKNPDKYPNVVQLPPVEVKMAKEDEEEWRNWVMERIEIDKRLVLCLDFDGVLHSYTTPWHNVTYIPDPPVKGAMQFLWDASEVFHIYVFGSRSISGAGRLSMQSWTEFHFRRHFNGSNPEVVDRKLRSISWPNYKPAAFLSIDDRAMPFEGTWPVVETLLKFKPWNKR